jgi:hypothetical protein
MLPHRSCATARNPANSSLQQVTLLSLLHIAASDAGRTITAGSEDLAVLLNIQDLRAAWADGCTAVDSGRTRPGDGTEVSERNHAVVALKVLDDPLGVLLAEARLAAEGVGDGLARADVGDGRRAGCL